MGKQKSPSQGGVPRGTPRRYGPAPFVLSQEDLDDYAAGRTTQAQLCQKYGKSAPTVRKALKRQGARPVGRRATLDERRAALWVAVYDDYVGVNGTPPLPGSQVARKHGLSAASVYLIVHKVKKQLEARKGDTP